ncbi:hypothetical protein GJ496_004826 [Pomphorhynchus laevis]|nr:hypothetical protein GJ496_004826 [Pomphorhynchus laevis]
MAALRNHSKRIDDSPLNSPTIEFDIIQKTLESAQELTNTGRTLKDTINQSVSKGKETLANLIERCNLALQNRMSSVNQYATCLNHNMNNYKSIADLESLLHEETAVAETIKVQLEQFENYARSDYIYERFICKNIIALKSLLEYRMESIRDLTEAIQNAKADIDRLNDLKISFDNHLSSMNNYLILDKLLLENLSYLYDTINNR